jgi:hypothetical protein
MKAFKYIRRSIALFSLMFVPVLDAVTKADTVVGHLAHLTAISIRFPADLILAPPRWPTAGRMRQ